MASPIDNITSIIRETVPGVTPANPAFKTFENIAGSEMSFDGTLVTSPVMRANREVAAAAYENQSGTGQLKTQTRRDTSTETLIEGILGNPFVSNVCKGGSTDYSHTIEGKMVHFGTSYYTRARGVYVTKLMLDVAPGAVPTYAFDYVYITKESSPTLLTSATYAAPTQGAAVFAKDIQNISIGGLNASFTALQMSIDQPREPQFVIGSVAAGAINAANQPRVTKVTATLLRTNLDVDALANTIVPVSFTVGLGTGNVHTWALPKAICSFPAVNSSGSSLTVTVELTATDDLTLGSGVSLTRS